VSDPNNLRELAAWYREFAERAGSPLGLGSSTADGWGSRVGSGSDRAGGRPANIGLSQGLFASGERDDGYPRALDRRLKSLKTLDAAPRSPSA